MEGMQKIRRGKGFAGVILYALKAGTHHRSDPTVIGGNLLSDSTLGLIAEFDTSKQLRPEVEKAVLHNSLRLPAGESLSKDKWVMFADDYMPRMGFSETHLHGDVLMWLMKTLLTSGCTNQLGAGQPQPHQPQPL